MEIDYGGDGRFTQISTGIPAFDAAVAAQIPFGQDLPIATSVDFPDLAMLGVAFGLTPNALWRSTSSGPAGPTSKSCRSSYETASQFSRTIPEEYEDAYAYRAGLSLASRHGGEWRFGYVFDETPQPEEAVGPLLPDSDRNGITLGYGYRGGWDFDIALMYLMFDERTRDQTFEPATASRPSSTAPTTPRPSCSV